MTSELPQSYLPGQTALDKTEMENITSKYLQSSNIAPMVDTQYYREPQ